MNKSVEGEEKNVTAPKETPVLHLTTIRSFLCWDLTNEVFEVGQQAIF